MFKNYALTALAFLSLALIIIVLTFVVHEGLLFYHYDMDPNYALIDRCFDLGGQWDTEKVICIALKT